MRLTATSKTSALPAKSRDDGMTPQTSRTLLGSPRCRTCGKAFLVERTGWWPRAGMFTPLDCRQCANARSVCERMEMGLVPYTK
jgi:hypothetical protein